MTQPDRFPDTGEQVEVTPYRDRGRTSRWVTVVAIAVGVAFLLLMVVLHLTGTMGPGAH